MKTIDCFTCAEPVDFPVSNDTVRANCTKCTMAGATKPGRYFPRDVQPDLALDNTYPVEEAA